jgi:hypothetical protein
VRLAIEQRERTLRAFVDRALLPDVPEDVRGHLFRFGAVLLCGHVERCIELIVLDRLQYRAQPRVLAFVKSHFRKGTNYDCNAIKQLLDRFDTDWGRKFETFIAAHDDIREGISSAYAVRNPLAHGNIANLGSNRLNALIDIAHRLTDGIIDATS